MSFLSSVFHVFNGEKWNGPEIEVAYDTRLFKTQKMIYRSPLYVKAFSRYKRKTTGLKKKKEKEKKKVEFIGNS